MALVSTKNKSNVEKAISAFMEIATNEVSSIFTQPSSHVTKYFGIVIKCRHIKRFPTGQFNLNLVPAGPRWGPLWNGRGLHGHQTDAKGQEPTEEGRQERVDLR